MHILGLVKINICLIFCPGITQDYGQTERLRYEITLQNTACKAQILTPPPPKKKIFKRALEIGKHFLLTCSNSTKPG